MWPRRAQASPSSILSVERLKVLPQWRQNKVEYSFLKFLVIETFVTYVKGAFEASADHIAMLLTVFGAYAMVETAGYS